MTLQQPSQSPGPASPSPASPSPASRGREPPEALRKAKVLIVDDHALVRRGLATMIGDESDLEVCGEAAEARLPSERLSDRELTVFQMIGQGLATREIAERLHLSVKTIETYREHIKAKLGLKNSAELSRHAAQWVLENS